MINWIKNWWNKSKTLQIKLNQEIELRKLRDLQVVSAAKKYSELKETYDRCKNELTLSQFHLELLKK